MCGQEISSGIVYVFEQTEFLTIESIINQESRLIEYPGLAGWFNRMWGTYFADHYFWSQPDLVARKYRTDIHRSKMIKPMPHMQEIDAIDPSQADITIYKLVKLKLIRFDAESPVHTALAQAKKLDQQQSMSRIDDPVMHALRCAIVGLDRYPHYKRAANS
jgi:hypothetical protein